MCMHVYNAYACIYCMYIMYVCMYMMYVYNVNRGTQVLRLRVVVGGSKSHSPVLVPLHVYNDVYACI